MLFNREQLGDHQSLLNLEKTSKLCKLKEIKLNMATQDNYHLMEGERGITYTLIELSSRASSNKLFTVFMKRSTCETIFIRVSHPHFQLTSL